MAIKSALFFCLIIVSLSKKHEDPPHKPPKKDEECFNRLSDLLGDLKDLGESIKNREEYDSLRKQLQFFLMKLQPTLLICAGTLEYDVSEKIEGIEPNISRIVDCKTAYIEYFNQIRRIIQAYNSNKVENVQKAASKLKIVEDKIYELCLEYSP